MDLINRSNFILNERRDYMFDKFDDVVNVVELCEMLKIGRNKAYELLSTSQIKSIKVGKVYKIPKRYIVDYIGLS